LKFHAGGSSLKGGVILSDNFQTHIHYLKTIFEASFGDPGELTFRLLEDAIIEIQNGNSTAVKIPEEDVRLLFGADDREAYLRIIKGLGVLKRQEGS